MKKRKLLIIGHIFPETNSTAAGWRMMKLIDSFRVEYDVVFATAAQPSDNSDFLTDGVKVINLPLNDDNADDILIEINPSVVIFDRFYTEEMFGWRVAEVLPNAWRILNTEDLHFLRLSREKWAKKANGVSPLFLPNELLTENTTRELASILRCHKSLIISKAEMKLLEEYFKISSSKLVFLPLQLPIVQQLREQDKTDFCFIGNGIHIPNADAIVWLVTSIWPKIQEKLPHAKLNIACSYTSSALRQLLAKKKNIRLFERVEDASLFVQSHKIQLMPIRFGAGIKGKVLESAVNKTPFVTTSIGMEGISENYPFQTDDEATFVEMALALFQDQQMYQNALLEMEKLISEYSDIEPYFQSLLQVLKTEPNADWFALTLLQQQTNATRYLSKYIIEKNKNN